LTIIKEHGLAEYLSKLYVTIIGNLEDQERIKSLLSGINYEIIYRNLDGACFEFPSLRKMAKLAKDKEFYAFYFHTKGASYSKLPDNNGFEWKRVQCARWRMLMNYYILYKWDIAINALLEEGYDAYGILYRERPKPHFSGNFWWTKSTTIKKAHLIDKNFTTNRYNAEFWILDQPGLKIYSPFKRGLLLSIRKINNDYIILPWWHWRNVLFAFVGATLAK